MGNQLGCHCTTGPKSPGIETPPARTQSECNWVDEPLSCTTRPERGTFSGTGSQPNLVGRLARRPPAVITPRSVFRQGVSSISAPPDDVALALIASLSGWADRVNLLSVNRSWGRRLACGSATWQQLCMCLATDHGVYVPSSCIDWKSLFLSLWRFRNVWHPSDPSCQTRSLAGEQGLQLRADRAEPPRQYRFDIAVIARLRSAHYEQSGSSSGSHQKELRLPLHQKLRWIQDSLGCSREQALLELFGPTHPDAFLHASPTDRPTERPPLSCVVCEPAQGVLSTSRREVAVCAPGVGLRHFALDGVLPQGSTQEDTYEVAARGQVATFLNGGNATVLCYGMTGSGKTHTLFGSTHSGGVDAGVVPLCLAEVQAAIRQREAGGTKCVLRLSYVEVYGERVRDLLHLESDKKGTAVRSVINGDIAVRVTSQPQLAELLLQGSQAKSKGATGMNATSSRAHTVLMLQLTQTKNDAELVSWLCLADLGGSEQLSKSSAEGERQAVQINLGLLSLKQCITALNQQQQHIPFSNSKLTSLLAPALSGNCKTTVIVTAAVEEEHAAATMQSLRFGELCSTVRTVTHSQLAADTTQLDAKLKSLQVEICRKEQWSVHTEKDAYGDGGGVRQYTQLAGAEKKRAELERLLVDRAQLLAPRTDDQSSAAQQGMPEAQQWVEDPPDLHKIVKRTRSAPLPGMLAAAAGTEMARTQTAPAAGFGAESTEGRQLKNEQKLRAADRKRAEREEIKKLEARARQASSAQKRAERKKRMQLGESIYSRFLVNKAEIEGQKRAATAAKIKAEQAAADKAAADKKVQSDEWVENRKRGGTPKVDKKVQSVVASLLSMGDAPALSECKTVCSHDRTVSFSDDVMPFRMGDVPEEFATRTVAGFTEQSGW